LDSRATTSSTRWTSLLKLVSVMVIELSEGEEKSTILVCIGQTLHYAIYSVPQRDKSEITRHPLAGGFSCVWNRTLFFRPAVNRFLFSKGLFDSRFPITSTTNGNNSVTTTTSFVQRLNFFNASLKSAAGITSGLFNA
jgi:hypothetical protein